VPRAIALPAPSYPLVRTTLANGLRVVLAPDRSAPVVGVAVYYDVGIRSEPQGRTGFAHLFEHLMFQGSANLEKLEHFRYVQSSGGTFNGSTHMDYTRYFEVLPSNALERGLFLEADRMRSPRITEENLANQIAVVKEEIRVNVLNRPYGGFPWILLPPVAFETFANSHNGYGDFVDLETSTVADATEFFDRYYAPANAVLCVAGDLDPDAAMALVERHFGDIPTRPAPDRPTFAEPDLTSERRKSTVDALAPIPAVAAAWRVPDPVFNLPEYLPYVVLAEILSDGDSSRLEQRLVQQDRSVTQLSAYLGLMGDPFDVRDPTVLIFQAFHPHPVTADQVLDAVTEEVDRLASGGLQTGELDRVRARIVAQLFRDIDPVLGRTLALAALEQQHGRANLLMELPALLSAVTEEQIRSAASMLRPDRRAVLELVPGGQPAPAPAAEAPARARRSGARSRPTAKAARTTRPAKAAKKAAKATRPAKGTKSARPAKAGTAVRPAKPAAPTKAAKAPSKAAKAAKAAPAKAAKAPAKAAKTTPAKAAKAAKATKAAPTKAAKATKAAPAKAAKAAKAPPAKAGKATAAKAGKAAPAKASKATTAKATRSAPAKGTKAGKATPAKAATATRTAATKASKATPSRAAKAAKASTATPAKTAKASKATKVAGTTKATKASKTTRKATKAAGVSNPATAAVTVPASGGRTSDKGRSGRAQRSGGAR
jgi:zinc protease